MTYLLDTDHISIHQAERGPEFDRLAARMDMVPESEFALSIVSFHEQSLGCHNFVANARNASQVVHAYRIFERLRRHFSEATVLPFDESAARTFQSLMRRRIRVGTMDLRIAAIALTNDLILLTRNAVDFAKVPDLTIEDWTV